MSFSWTCPYCHRDTTVTDDDYRRKAIGCLIRDHKNHCHSLEGFFIICPNKKCKKLALSCDLLVCQTDEQADSRYGDRGDFVQRWNLLPSSTSKNYPNYIPSAIRQDYKEACSIKESSPKASATLARRCLQGMIRDFWKVEGATLAQEIHSIKDKIDPTTLQEINSVRKIGNIGAHMEKDVNLIVDIEPKEVDLLIKLIEDLLDEWYVNRYQRQARAKELENIVKEKTQQKQNANS